jgi:hypothetical protein
LDRLPERMRLCDNHEYFLLLRREIICGVNSCFCTLLPPRRVVRVPRRNMSAYLLENRVMVWTEPNEIQDVIWSTVIRGDDVMQVGSKCERKFADQTMVGLGSSHEFHNLPPTRGGSSGHVSSVVWIGPHSDNLRATLWSKRPKLKEISSSEWEWRSTDSGCSSTGRPQYVYFLGRPNNPLIRSETSDRRGKSHRQAVKRVVFLNPFDPSPPPYEEERFTAANANVPAS